MNGICVRQEPVIEENFEFQRLFRRVCRRDVGTGTSVGSLHYRIAHYSYGYLSGLQLFINNQSPLGSLARGCGASPTLNAQTRIVYCFPISCLLSPWRRSISRPSYNTCDCWNKGPPRSMHTIQYNASWGREAVAICMAGDVVTTAGEKGVVDGVVDLRRKRIRVLVQ